MIRPADLARLSPEREADAVRAMAQRELDRSRDAAFMPPISILEAVGAYVYNENAAEALAALRDAGFIVLHEDDVTAERKISGPAAPLWIGKGVGPSGRTCVSRLVTPWRKVSE